MGQNSKPRLRQSRESNGVFSLSSTSLVLKQLKICFGIFLFVMKTGEKFRPLPDFEPETKKQFREKWGKLASNERRAKECLSPRPWFPTKQARSASSGSTSHMSDTPFKKVN